MNETHSLPVEMVVCLVPLVDFLDDILLELVCSLTSLAFLEIAPLFFDSLFGQMELANRIVILLPLALCHFDFPHL